MFYVYKWFLKETNQVFYVGKGVNKRYKETAQRNKIFKDILEHNKCDVEIIKYFDNEEDAFKYENEMILYYKENGQAWANLDNGGTGGCHFIWTPEMKEYSSKYNVMKRPEQRERMSKNNPMYNKEAAAKSGKAHRRPVIINGKEYEGVRMAADELHVSEPTIRSWCRIGENSQGWVCYYKDSEPVKKIQVPKRVGIGRYKGIEIIIDGVYYPTLKAGAQAIHGDPCKISTCIKENRLYNGHVCKYANQQPSQEND